MKGTRAMTSAERTRKQRQKIQDEGGRIIQVYLSPDSAAALERLVGDHGTITQAVEFALQSKVRE
jgi:hypothetical protein